MGWGGGRFRAAVSAHLQDTAELRTTRGVWQTMTIGVGGRRSEEMQCGGAGGRERARYIRVRRPRVSLRGTEGALMRVRAAGSYGLSRRARVSERARRAPLRCWRSEGRHRSLRGAFVVSIVRGARRVTYSCSSDEWRASFGALVCFRISYVFFSLGAGDASVTAGLGSLSRVGRRAGLGSGLGSLAGRRAARPARAAVARSRWGVGPASSVRRPGGGRGMGRVLAAGQA